MVFNKARLYPSRSRRNRSGFHAAAHFSKLASSPMPFPYRKMRSSTVLLRTFRSTRITSRTSALLIAWSRGSSSGKGVPPHEGIELELVLLKTLNCVLSIESGFGGPGFGIWWTKIWTTQAKGSVSLSSCCCWIRSIFDQLFFNPACAKVPVRTTNSHTQSISPASCRSKRVDDHSRFYAMRQA